MARTEYADPEDLPPEKRSLLDTLSEKDDEDAAVDHRLEGGTLNVYRTMGCNVALLEAFREYGSTVWREGGLSPHQREFVILATAYHPTRPTSGTSTPASPWTKASPPNRSSQSRARNSTASSQNWPPSSSTSGSSWTERSTTTITRR
ncbi:carboxymuconolactone decarboxylase family protein [Halobiforma nitratireducens]|uniref:Carboxymuconolactone decarboxylase n=1 Tax=Halobiforma nitratireducens JCM 10879 TaxID=1227454 RepID=M0LBU0_9EURY|nr:hypothetical protein [Halobiforma nitratireducens]EMA30583.1 carboxymuconolactone decarboxylase [Halobiforma nitratireducens JCM 10879]